VSLLTPAGECYSAAGYDETAVSRVTAQDLIFMAAFAPTLRSSSWLTLQLGTGEINRAGGVPTGGSLRPLILLLCQDSTVTLDVAMDHLVHELGVRALVASLEDIQLRAALERPSTRGQALYLSPNGSDSWSSSSDAAESLLWHLGASYSEVVRVYPALLERVLANFERAGGRLDEFRMAVLESDAREDRDLASAVLEQLRASLNVEQFRREGRLRSFDATAVQREQTDLLSYAPDVVLVFAGGLASVSPYPERANVVALLEEAEPAMVPFQPYYVFGPRNSQDISLATLAARSESFRQRAVGVTAERPLEPERARAVDERFRAAFPELSTELALGVSFATYDALYYLASAWAVAAPTALPVTATSIAENFERVTAPGGEPIDLAAPFAEISTSLRERAPQLFNASGTTGPAEFDAQRTRSALPRVYCWPSGGSSALVAQYDAAQELSVVRSDCARDLLGTAGE
jgi:hypothetical protein